MAEEFLVKIMRKGSDCKTSDELRVWSYHHAKCVLIEELPPTSKSIRLHILRSFYVVYTQINCLNKYARQLNPTEYGWNQEDDLLLPEKVLILLPSADELIYNVRVEYVEQNRAFVYQQQFLAVRSVYVRKIKLVKINLMI